MAALVTLALLCYSAQARTRDLTESEARELVAAAVGVKARTLPGFGLESNNNANVPGFLKFDATFNNPHGSPVLGFYAVNLVTGDVWKLVICRKLDSPELRRLRAVLHMQIQVTVQELREFTSKAPCEL